MSWESLLIKKGITLIVPWAGGREIRAQRRVFHIEGPIPKDHGWHEFEITGGRKVSWKGPVEPVVEEMFVGSSLERGYLVGDRFVPDTARVPLDPLKIIEQTEPIYLVEPGLERFARVRAARWEDGRLIYVGQEFPLGPEGEVLDAFLDQKSSVTQIKGITPALDLAFRFETWNRAEQIRLREEAERLVREEAERAALEERRAHLVQQLGTGEGRRQMAVVDFEAGARAALQVSGAELMDVRDTRVAGEAVVHFRFQNRKWECVVQKQTLRIVDAGICLVDHDTGRRDDTLLTLESLPGTISQAIREGKLVVFRHVDERGGYVRDEEDWQEDDY